MTARTAPRATRAPALSLLAATLLGLATGPGPLPIARAEAPAASPGPASAAAAAAAAAPRVVEIVAKRFQFTPAEVTLRRGEPVVLRLRSEDVTHGFFTRALRIDATIDPAAPLDLPLTPAVAGRFPIICDHFCGAGHGNMKMTIVVVDAAP